MLCVVCIQSDAHSTDTTKAIRSLDHIIFLDNAQTMYKAFLGCIEGLQTQNTIIIEIVKGVQPG